MTPVLWWRSDYDATVVITTLSCVYSRRHLRPYRRAFIIQALKPWLGIWKIIIQIRCCSVTFTHGTCFKQHFYDLPNSRSDYSGGPNRSHWNNTGNITLSQYIRQSKCVTAPTNSRCRILGLVGQTSQATICLSRAHVFGNSVLDRPQFKSFDDSRRGLAVARWESRLRRHCDWATLVAVGLFFAKHGSTFLLYFVGSTLAVH